MTSKLRITKINNLKCSKLGFFYIIMMIILNIHQAALIQGYYLTPFIIAFLFFLLGVYAYLNCLGTEIKVKNSIILLKILIAPWCFFFIYNLFIYASGNGTINFLKSSFVQIMFTPIILLGAWGSVTLMGKNTLKYLIYSYIFSYIIIITVLFLQMGPNAFFNGILSILTGIEAINPFERNSDIIFALGLLIIYYFDHYIRNNTNENLHTFIFMILLFLGGKRIILLATIVIGILVILLSKLCYKRKIYIQNLISLVWGIGCFVFVFILINQILSEFIYSHNINSMGRIQMWDYIAQFAKFSPFYIGKGYAFSNLQLEVARVWTWNGNVFALHSDVLKMYVDLGFLCFLYWIVYNFYIAPRKIRKNFGLETRNLFWFMTFYLFIIYLTDNAINYPIVQNLYFVLLFQIIYFNKKDINIIDINKEIANKGLEKGD